MCVWVNVSVYGHALCMQSFSKFNDLTHSTIMNWLQIIIYLNRIKSVKRRNLHTIFQSLFPPCKYHRAHVVVTVLVIFVTETFNIRCAVHRLNFDNNFVMQLQFKMLLWCSTINYDQCEKVQQNMALSNILSKDIHRYTLCNWFFIIDMKHW